MRFLNLIAAAFRAGLFLLLIILAVDDKYILPGEFCNLYLSIYFKIKPFYFANMSAFCLSLDPVAVANLLIFMSDFQPMTARRVTKLYALDFEIFDFLRQNAGRSSNNSRY